MVEWYRHGDVAIIKMDKMDKKELEGKKEVEGILKTGETTGHAHRVKDTNTATVLITEEGRQLQAEQETIIIHEDHKPIPIPPGLNEIRSQREFNHYIQVTRDVQD